MIKIVKENTALQLIEPVRKRKIVALDNVVEFGGEIVGAAFDLYRFLSQPLPEPTITEGQNGHMWIGLT